MTPDKIARLRKQVKLFDVLSRYMFLYPVKILAPFLVFRMRHGLGKWTGRCPFCHDEEKSFHINLRKGLYHCWRCGAGGDMFTFIMEKENLSLGEAVDFIDMNYYKRK
jgi:DNA primase